ncbi:hypothetical protein GCM10023165_56130 [Variovorax defluvii]|uniref:Uncharacterized protein n=1 Tax=Variovorax defluvii TaxID=913761 RepID=A0ABP8IIP7_9BURK
MPIATPPPDFDPTIVPPAHKELTEAQARETGVATGSPTSPAGPNGLVPQDKRITDLVKLWPQDRPTASLLVRASLAKGW